MTDFIELTLDDEQFEILLDSLLLSPASDVNAIQQAADLANCQISTYLLWAHWCLWLWLCCYRQWRLPSLKGIIPTHTVYSDDADDDRDIKNTSSDESLDEARPGK